MATITRIIITLRSKLRKYNKGSYLVVVNSYKSRAETQISLLGNRFGHRRTNQTTIQTPKASTEIRFVPQSHMGQEPTTLLIQMTKIFRLAWMSKLSISSLRIPSTKERNGKRLIKIMIK